jgi:hypothetical protein
MLRNIALKAALLFDTQQERELWPWRSLREVIWLVYSPLMSSHFTDFVERSGLEPTASCLQSVLV